VRLAVKNVDYLSLNTAQAGALGSVIEQNDEVLLRRQSHDYGIETIDSATVRNDRNILDAFVETCLRDDPAVGIVTLLRLVHQFL
jgi:hypothetical protein